MKKIYASLLFLASTAVSIAQSCISSNPSMNVSTTTPCGGQTVTLTCSGGALSLPNTGQRWTWAQFSSASCSAFSSSNFVNQIGGFDINSSGISGTIFVITQPITYLGIVAMNGACLTNIPCAGIMTITRQNGPTITVPPGVRYFCPATPISITATVTGSPISHAWYKGAVAVIGATTTVLSFTNPVIGDAGSYTLRSVNACGTSTSSAVTLATLGNETITGVVNTLTNTVRGYAVSNLASQGVTYNWALPIGGGTITAGATTSSATVNWGSTVGIYSITVTKTLGSCIVTDTKTVSVETCNTAPLSLSNITTGAAQICPTTTVNLVAMASGSFTWSTSQNGAIINVSPTVTTTYSVQSTDLLGCPKSGTIQVLVGAAPQLTIVATTSLVCAGEEITITGSGANSYTWTSNGNTPSIVVTPSLSTTYYLTGTSLDMCNSSSQISIAVSPCAGINEFDNTKFLVYPNPAKNYVTIEASTILYYEIYDAIGIKVAFGTIDDKHNQIDVSNFSKGVYIIQLNDGKTKGIKRMIKE